MGKKDISSRKISAKWKPVEISGSLLNGSEDLGGFAGLEVLENYDSSFLLGNKKNKVNFSRSNIIIIILTLYFRDFP